MTLPEWVDLPNVSARTNALMYADWELINEAAAILARPSLSPADVEQLQDIWTESLAVETRLARSRDEEVA